MAKQFYSSIVTVVLKLALVLIQRDECAKSAFLWHLYGLKNNIEKSR